MDTPFGYFLAFAFTFAMGGWDKAAGFVDGTFGPTTASVLAEWQRKTQQLTPDGVCGPATWAWLVGV